MTKLFDIFPDHDALPAPEPEEVAGDVIEFLNSNEESQPSLFNSHNFRLPGTVEGYPKGKKDEILKVLIEGWIWLEKEGLTAPKPGSFNEG